MSTRTAMSTVFAVSAVATDFGDAAPAAATATTARAASGSSTAFGSRTSGIASCPFTTSTFTVNRLLTHNLDVAVRVLWGVVSASHIFILLLVPATRGPT
jgi:hypothetical protein